MCGGLKTIVNALLAHVESGQVQKEGLTALKNLATSTINKETVRLAGGEEAILLSMQVNYNFPEVLCAAFSALNNIAVDRDMRTVAPTSPEVLGCVKQAMTRYANSAQVQNNACFLLKSLTYEERNLELMQHDRNEFLKRLAVASARYPDLCRERAQYIMKKL